MSVKFAQNFEGESARKHSEFARTKASTSIAGSNYGESRHSILDRNQGLASILKPSSQHQSQPQLPQEASSSKRIKTQLYGNRGSSINHLGIQEVPVKLAREEEITNAMLVLYRGSHDSRQDAFPQKPKTHQQTPVRASLQHGYATSYKYALRTSKDFTLKNILTRISDEADPTSPRTSLKPPTRSGMATRERVSASHDSGFGQNDSDGEASTKLSRVKISTAKKSSFMHKRNSVDTTNEHLLHEIKQQRQKLRHTQSQLSSLGSYVHDLHLHQSKFIVSHKHRKDNLKQSKKKRHHKETDDLEHIPKFESQIANKIVVELKEDTIGKLLRGEKDDEYEEDYENLSDENSAKSLKAYQARIKGQKLCYQLNENDPSSLKDLKYTMRIQDMQQLMHSNIAVIMPDPRMRSPDRVVSLEFFDHSLRGDYQNKKQCVFGLGDPRKKHVDFMQDMNEINRHSNLVRKRLPHIRQSESMAVTRDRITNEMKRKQTKIEEMMLQKAQNIAMQKYAQNLDQLHMLRHPSMIVKIDEKQPVSTADMGLFAILQKNLMEEKKATDLFFVQPMPQITATEESDPGDFTQIAERERAQNKVEMKEISAVNLHQQKLQQVKHDLHKRVSQKWITQQQTLEFSMRKKRDELHATNKVIGLIKKNSAKKLPDYKFETLHKKYQTQLAMVKLKKARDRLIRIEEATR